jgi:hypothetical protein
METTDLVGTETLDFFESVFTTIPPVYRQVDTSEQTKSNKKAKAGKSLLDLHEHAAVKIKAEQKRNRDKSLAKIKELTEMHKQNKLTKEEVKSRV